MNIIGLRYYRLKNMWIIFMVIICLEFIYFLIGQLCSSFDNDVKKLSLALKYRDENQVMNRQSSIRNIVIMAAYRTGSTFIGELFRQNNDVYYTYEPLKFFYKHPQYSMDKNYGPRIVKRVFSCDMKIMSVLYFKGYNWAIKYHNTPLDKIFEMCQTRKIRATKLILQDNLERLASNFGNDTAILLLIRDPRGILNSRDHLSVRKEHPANQTHHQYRLQVLTQTCRNFLTNMRYIQNLGATQDKDKPYITLVKYEDVANSPLQEAKKLYKYLGLQLPINIAEWIKNNTNDPNKASIYRVYRSPFSTLRNSSAMATKWLVQLRRSSIFKVQNISECAEVIRMAGYKLVV